MPPFELVLNFSAVGLLLMFAAMVFVAQRGTVTGKLLVGLALSLAALLIADAAEPLGLVEPAHLTLTLFSAPNTILVWLVAKSMLDGDFRMDWRHWGIAATWCVPLWLLQLDFHGWFDLFSKIHVDLLNAYGAALFVYLATSIMLGHSDDLLEPRRRARYYFVIAMVVVTIMAILSEFVLYRISPDLIGTFKLLAVYPLLIAAYFWLIQVKPAHFAFVENGKATASAPLEPKLLALKSKLDAELEVHKVWREPDLSIVSLAKRLGTTQHSLRTLINQGLGFQNFRTYLNSYRIEAIKSDLADPEKSNLSILQVAIDNGFSSISAFNKAFKDNVGVPPRTYRTMTRQNAKE